MATWRRGGGDLLRRAAVAAPPWRLTPSAAYHRTIQAVPREHTGSRVAAKLRAAGFIPSVVLSPGEGGGPATQKQLLTTEAKQIREILKQSPFFCSTPIQLQVRAGPRSAVVLDSGTVLPIKVHRKEETGEILNLVMAWAEKGLEMKVDVPVVYKGEDVCLGLKKGGYLHKIRTSLKYLCPTEHIPPKIEVDLTNLDIGDRVLMHDIEVHPSLKLLSKNDTMPICKILATKPVEPEPKPISEATETQEATGV
ncbi:50S ribosomal protein L25-like [Cocos nucifera]|uniref:50S ribosomal protein L25-like n=1 Tax=Cocos nucifera TaxID=13894 RepID=A0A8K0NCR7_COCNU|nr:50S ribosomal protein L25-like [Cocos nucifera]